MAQLPGAVKEQSRRHALPIPTAKLVAGIVACTLHVGDVSGVQGFLLPRPFFSSGRSHSQETLASAVERGTAQSSALLLPLASGGQVCSARGRPSTPPLKMGLPLADALTRFSRVGAGAANQSVKSLSQPGWRGFAPALAFAGLRASGVPLPPALLTNQWYVWTILMASSSAGLWSERTKWGAAVSSPLVTMLLTITLCNVGVLPASSPVYSTVNQVFVPLAVPLLLYDADLRKVLRFAGTLLACFCIGAAGTVVGTAVAAIAVPLGLGSDGWKVAAALAARHIGGAVNYVAVCETLGVSADAVVAGLAADNMVVSLYFIFLFWVTKPEPSPQALRQAQPAQQPPASETPGAKSSAVSGGRDAAADESGIGDTGTMANSERSGSVEMLATTKETITYALAAACALCFTGEVLSKAAFGGKVNPIPLVTLATVAGATIAPSLVGRLGSVGAQLGVLFMQLFFAVTGAQGSLAVVMGTAPSLLMFSVVQIAAHFGFLVGVGRLFRLPFRELALASNANVGGPTTAAAMAAAKGWKTLVLPALLTGVLGYATATFIGVGIGHAMLSSLMRVP